MSKGSITEFKGLGVTFSFSIPRDPKQKEFMKGIPRYIGEQVKSSSIHK